MTEPIELYCNACRKPLTGRQTRWCSRKCTDRGFRTLARRIGRGAGRPPSNAVKVNAEDLLFIEQELASLRMTLKEQK